jgi:hypothetical protein
VLILQRKRCDEWVSLNRNCANFASHAQRSRVAVAIDKPVHSQLIIRRKKYCSFISNVYKFTFFRTIQHNSGIPQSVKPFGHYCLTQFHHLYTTHKKLCIQSNNTARNKFCLGITRVCLRPYALSDDTHSRAYIGLYMTPNGAKCMHQLLKRGSAPTSVKRPKSSRDVHAQTVGQPISYARDIECAFRYNVVSRLSHRRRRHAVFPVRYLASGAKVFQNYMFFF